MMLKRVAIILLFLVHATQVAQAQTDYFEGVVTYTIKEFDRWGNAVELPVNKEEIFFSQDIILTRHTSGPFLLMGERVDVYLNARENVKYLVNHTTMRMKKMQPPADVELITPIEETKLYDEEINGYPCEVNRIKYVHRYTGPFGETADTLNCTYYNSKTMKISKPKVFALLQGNRNTLLLDGRYAGLPLKVVYSKSDGSLTSIESVLVKQTDVDAQVKLPDYEVISN